MRCVRCKNPARKNRVACLKHLRADRARKAAARAEDIKYEARLRNAPKHPMDGVEFGGLGLMEMKPKPDAPTGLNKWGRLVWEAWPSG